MAPRNGKQKSGARLPEGQSVPERKGSAAGGLWPFGIVAVYFLVGLWGHAVNSAMNEAARAGNSPTAAPLPADPPTPSQRR
jgi:hypothetical protein